MDDWGLQRKGMLVSKLPNSCYHDKSPETQITLFPVPTNLIPNLRHEPSIFIIPASAGTCYWGDVVVEIVLQLNSRNQTLADAVYI